MRRSEQEITNEATIEAIIQKAKFCRLGLVDEDQPYIVPLCFGYQDKVLYFHSALEGRKIDIISRNPKACFEVEVNAKVVEATTACSWSVEYQSVIGFGKVSLIENPEEKRNAFAIIMAHYSQKDFKFPDKTVQKTSIIRMEVEEMTGKQCEI